MPTASATISAQKVSSRVAAPLVMSHRADRLVVGQRVPEVAVQHADEVVPVLAQDRAIQSRVVPADRDLFGWEPPAERRLDRIADDPHHEEHER